MIFKTLFKNEDLRKSLFKSQFLKIMFLRQFLFFLENKKKKLI